MLTTTLRERYNYDFHFTDKEDEDRKLSTCSGSDSKRFKSRLLSSRILSVLWITAFIFSQYNTTWIQPILLYHYMIANYNFMVLNCINFLTSFMSICIWFSWHFVWYLKIKQCFIRQLSTFMAHLSLICIGPPQLFLFWADLFSLWRQRPTPLMSDSNATSFTSQAKWVTPLYSQRVIFFHYIELFTYLVLQ